MLSHCASTMTKPATMAIRAFAIRKARRYLQRDGEWLTEEATDDILDTIEESFGLATKSSGSKSSPCLTQWSRLANVRLT